MRPRRLRPMIVGVPPRVGAAYAGIGRRNCGSRLRSRRVRTIRSFAPGITRDNSGIRGMPTLASGLRISSQLGPVETIPQTHRGPHGLSMIRSVKRAIVGMSGNPSNIRLMFVYRRARRVRWRLPPPPPSPGGARAPGLLWGNPEFFRGFQVLLAGAGAAPEKRDTPGARWQPVSRRSSREPGFVVRGGTFPWHPPAEGGDGGSGRGTAVGIPVVPENPGISRTIFFGPTASMSSAARGANGHSRVNGATLGIVDHTVTHGASHDREPLSGLVERVTFHSPETGFCVLRVKVRGHRDLVTVLGSAASIQPGEFIQASGRWGHSPRARPAVQDDLPEGPAAQLSRRHREIPWQRHDQRHRPAFRQEAGHGVR